MKASPASTGPTVMASNRASQGSGGGGLFTQEPPAEVVGQVDHHLGRRFAQGVSLDPAAQGRMAALFGGRKPRPLIRRQLVQRQHRAVAPDLWLQLAQLGLRRDQK